MKILCVCQGGCTRSVAMAYVLKKKYQQDALAISWKYNSQETMNHLCNWAELIIGMSGSSFRRIPSQFQSKSVLFDIGTDKWNSIPKEKELVDLCIGKWEKYQKETKGAK